MPLILAFVLALIAGCGATPPLKPDTVSSHIIDETMPPAPEFDVSVERTQRNLLITMQPTDRNPSGNRWRFDPKLPGCWTFRIFLSTDEDNDREDYSGWNMLVDALPWYWAQQGSRGAGVWIIDHIGWSMPPNRGYVHPEYNHATRAVKLEIPLSQLDDDGNVLYQIQINATFLRDGVLASELIKSYSGKSVFGGNLAP